MKTWLVNGKVLHHDEIKAMDVCIEDGLLRPLSIRETMMMALSTI